VPLSAAAALLIEACSLTCTALRWSKGEGCMEDSSSAHVQGGLTQQRPNGSHRLHRRVVQLQQEEEAASNEDGVARVNRLQSAGSTLQAGFDEGMQQQQGSQ